MSSRFDFVTQSTGSDGQCKQVKESTGAKPCGMRRLRIASREHVQCTAADQQDKSWRFPQSHIWTRNRGWYKAFLRTI
jgi:hypothetical protein